MLVNQASDRRNETAKAVLLRAGNCLTIHSLPLDCVVKKFRADFSLEVLATGPLSCRPAFLFLARIDLDLFCPSRFLTGLLIKPGVLKGTRDE
jgi:hypothetical protein